jgi:hypothetical protein
LREDDEIPNRDVSRAGEHEQHGRGHFLGLHQAPGRQRVIELRLRPVAQQRRDDGAGRDRADADSVPCDLSPERVYERLDRVLRGRVDRLDNDRDEAGDRAGHDDVAGLPLDHVRQDRVDGSERRVYVEVQHPVPGVGVAPDDVAPDVRSRVGVEDVQAAGLLQDPRHHAGHARRIEKVDDQGDRLGAEFRANVPQPLLGMVGKHDAGAGGQQGPRAFEADARRGAGDRRNLTRQLVAHP